MPKDTNKPTNSPAPVTPTTLRKERTAQNTLRVVTSNLPDGNTLIVAMVNRLVSTQLVFNPSDASLTKIYDTMGSYEGFPKFYRAHIERFKTILLTKSEDLSVVEAQGAAHVVEEFIRGYLDRVITKAALAKAQDEANQAANPQHA